MPEPTGKRVVTVAGVARAVVAATAIGLSACGGSSSLRVASLGTGTGSTGSSRSSPSGGSSMTKLARRNPARLVDEWAACERSHGAVDQADPIIDAHGVINITVPPPGSGGPLVGDPHGVTGTCSEYLAAAQAALRAADPVQDPLGMNNQVDLLKDVRCMRANGVPNYPYPTGNTTNFNGTGVDPTAPFVVKISIKCGNELHLPLWWSAGWGPPGDVSVGMSIPPGTHAPGAAVPATGRPNRDAPARPATSNATSGSATGG